MIALHFFTSAVNFEQRQPTGCPFSITSQLYRSFSARKYVSYNFRLIDEALQTTAISFFFSFLFFLFFLLNAARLPSCCNPSESICPDEPNSSVICLEWDSVPLVSISPAATTSLISDQNEVTQVDCECKQLL